MPENRLNRLTLANIHKKEGINEKDTVFTKILPRRYNYQS